MFNAKTIDNFISADEASQILNFVKGVEDWEAGGSEFWDNRCLNGFNIHSKNPEVGSLLFNIRERMKEVIPSLYGLDVPVYPDLTQVVRWFPGMEQPAHCDDMTYVDGHDWFHHRHYGAIIYLNDDYEGGHTFYPDYDVSVTPQSGRLAIHPGDKNHFHGVSKIEKNIRYTIASFWTLDKEYFDGWSLP